MISTVGVLSPGDMGHSIASVLRHGGLRVVSCLEGRSDRTRALAAEAGVDPVPSLDAMVETADVILSVLVPSQAASVAKQLAESLKRTGAHPLIADCNAIAPNTARAIGLVLELAGGRFVDAGIIGPPPVIGGRMTRIYVSGEHAREVTGLAAPGLDVRFLGTEIGQSSGLKMCYAALTKGLIGLATELHVAAEIMGLSEPLHDEFVLSQPLVLGWLEQLMPSMPPKAFRWVGEMEEIAATFEATGLTPLTMLGAADIYRLVEMSPLGSETPEHRSQGLSIGDIAEVLAAEIARQGSAAKSR